MQRVVKVKTDIKQLVPTIDYIIENYGVVPKNILADNGYYSLDAIEYAHKKRITALIPDYNDAVKNNGTKSDNPHAKPNLYFDPVLKFFRCVMSKKLTIAGTRMKDEIEYDVFKTKFCKECPLHDECTSSSYRELFEPHNTTFYIRKQDFLSENVKYLYKFRAIYSEGVFGDLKQNREFRQTKRRGRHKLEIDLKLEAIVTNIKKIAKYFEGTFIILKDS